MRGNARTTNTEGRSCNNCCSGKAVSSTYSDSEFVALGNHQAMRMRLTVICGLSGCTIYLSRKRYNFRKKRLLSLKCVFLFSLQLVPKHFSF